MTKSRDIGDIFTSNVTFTGTLLTPLVAGGKVVVSDLGTLTTGTETVDLSSAQN